MRSVYLTRDFWAGTAERMVRAVATWTLTTVAGLDAGLGILSVNFELWASGAGLAAVVSLCTSLLGAKIGDDSPSFVSR